MSTNNYQRLHPLDTISSDDSIIDLDMNIDNRNDKKYNKQTQKQKQKQTQKQNQNQNKYTNYPSYYSDADMDIINDNDNALDNIPLLNNYNDYNADNANNADNTTQISNNDNIVRANANNIQYFQRRNTQSQQNNNKRLINSPSYRNFIMKRIIWKIFLITFMASIGLALMCNGFHDTGDAKGNDIYNIDVEYSYYYFYIIMICYAFYMFINLVSIVSIVLLDAKAESIIGILWVNGIVFNLSVILRLFIGIFIVIKMIDNTPIMKITNFNQQNIYLPKYINYMIIEIIYFGFLIYPIGYYNGMINALRI